MRVGTLAVVVLLLLLAVPRPAVAQGESNDQIITRTVPIRGGSDDRPDWDRSGRQITIEGIVVDVDRRGRGILEVQTRAFDRRAPLWTVRLTARTRVELPRSRDFHVVRRTDVFRLFRAGDLVEVEGHLLGGRQILAEEITLRSRRGFPGWGGFPGPDARSWRTVILFPQPGTVIESREFSVVGETMPGAQVRFEVVARYGIFQQPVTSGTTTAGRDGRFAFVVRPTRYFSGTVYTITVTSTFRGVSAEPVSVTVRQP